VACEISAARCPPAAGHPPSGAADLWSPIAAEDHISDGCDVVLVPWKFGTLVPAGRDLGLGGQGADGRDQGARRPAAALRSRNDGSGSFRI
jgi:hypothetical protein